MSFEDGERWGIVGGGLLGLTLAHRLAQQGKRVTLIEGAAELGGLASAWRLGDVVWDRHYHVTLLSDLHLRALLRELGLEREMEWVKTRTGFYAGGRLHSLSNSLEYLRFPVLGLAAKLRLAATIAYAARLRDWKRLERIPATDWLVRCSGRRTFDEIWLPLLRAKLGENYRHASAAFIWAVIQRLYAARRTGLKQEMFGYVPGGYARVLARFAEVVAGEGVRIELGRPVARVERAGGALKVRFQPGGEESFDQVVVTAAAPIAARLCAGLTLEEEFRLKSIRYQGIVCASLLLERPLGGYYLTYITDEAMPFTAVVEMSALVDRKHFGGRSLVYLPKYVTPDDPWFAMPDVEIELRFLAALRRMYPDLKPGEVADFKISRVRQVLAISTLGYSDRLPPMTTSVPGLHIVNSAHIVNGTLNVNETVQLAETAARALGTASRSAPAPATGLAASALPAASL
jgi:protoporphyrinogen oxidase